MIEYPAMNEPSTEPSPTRFVTRFLACALALAVLPLAIALCLVLYTLLRFRGKRPAACGEPVLGESRLNAVKTMSDLMDMIDRIPFSRGVPRLAATLAISLTDLLPALMNASRVTSGVFYPYPRVFEPLMLESQDGTPLCGVAAFQAGAGSCPAVILVHGLFSSKNNFGMLWLALKAFYDWGFHVLVIDLRNFGDTSRYSEAPTSWGFREADDIVSAADCLSAIDRVSTVGVLGVSMGAASALIAAGRSKLDGPLSGGVIALNGYADAERAIEEVAGLHSGNPEKFLTWLYFRVMLLAKTVLGGPRPLSDLREYTRQVSSQYYEVTEKELYRKASPINSVRDIEVPCLIIHSRDDMVVPVREAHDLIEATRDNPMVASIVTPRGGHALYLLTNPRWFHEVIRTFFRYWSESDPGPDLARDGVDSANYFGNPNN